jgi:uncharacterized protein (TIGR02271 family)
MATIQKDRILQFRGQDLCDSSGDKLGQIEEIYLDAQTDEPEWALIHTGLFGTKRTFVPISDATETDGKLTVQYDKATVKDAPQVEANGQLSQREESELYRYYGLAYSDTDTGSGTGRTDIDTDVDVDRSAGVEDAAGTVGRDTSGPTTDQAMTRSEEELRVGKTQRESGRARLRKYVVTDEVTETVPVQREEVRIEREPITDANVGNAMDGPAISEEEHEVVLHEEEVVAEKRAVPKERVRLDKDTVTEERQISEEVRREEIDIDDSGRGTR